MTAERDTTILLGRKGFVISVFITNVVGDDYYAVLECSNLETSHEGNTYLPKYIWNNQTKIGLSC